MTDLPFYEPSGNEIALFQHAFNQRLPLLIKGPTGCGKTRFVEYMAWRLYRQAETERRKQETPLITVACHEDLTATDLVGRYLLSGDETVWMDGPLTRAVRSGAICYLDEVVEVPAGFETDFASVPRLPVAYWLTGDTAHAAATVHDYMVRHRTTNSAEWRDAAHVFAEAMTAEQVAPWRRSAMYWIVVGADPYQQQETTWDTRE